MWVVILIGLVLLFITKEYILEALGKHEKLLQSLFPKGKKEFLLIGQIFCQKITEVNDSDYRKTLSISEDSSLVVFSFMFYELLFLYFWSGEKSKK